MPPAPLPAYENQRLTALLACNVMDTPPEEGFDDLTRLARKLCDTPIALISLLDENRQWFKSRVGLETTQTPRDAAFCGYAILQQGPLVIEDARHDERTFDNPLVAGPPGIRFYAGVPLMVDGGLPLGTLCVIDTRPRKASPAMLEDLVSLARQAACQLELRRTIANLRDMQHRAEAANHAKSAFLAHMSHELRTPLTSIVGYADLLLEESAPERAIATRAIARNATHLLEVVNDILDIAKIEAGMLPIEQTHIDPCGILADATRMIIHKAEEKGLRIETAFSTPVPETILCDALRLRQILLNLLANAIRFTERGGITLSLRADPQAGLFMISVRDTGIGMTPQQVRRISRFEAFQQADNTTSRRFGGTGLGLRIANNLATLLGGSLGIESRIGHGSDITLTIPYDPENTTLRSPEAAQRAHHLALHTPASAHGTAEPSTAPLDGVRVLLVEDSIDNQRLLALHLRRAGATVDVACNGHEAVAKAKQAQPYDCLLMDLEMPGMDGCEATQRLRDAGLNTPIVFLSAHATSESRTRALQAGGNDYLTKPISTGRLVAACQHWAGTSRQLSSP
ncbi:MAG: response regulator [Phycisphaeraceae bacterium]|nr:response regulator [Phycisphaeraceae bacterium]